MWLSTIAPGVEMSHPLTRLGRTLLVAPGVQPVP